MLQERSNGGKRKVPDSNYIPGFNPVYTRTISHQHTNSLPVDPGILHPQASISNHGSINNLSETRLYLTPSKSTYNQPFASPNNHINSPNHGHAIKAEPVQQPLMPTNVLKNQFHTQARFNNNLHSRHLSLPVEMPPNNNIYANQGGYLAQQQQHIGSVEEIPLPEGWSSERTPTGQVYFINHVTQTTTWDDPRKQFGNQGIVQNEQSSDVKSIIRKMPLPAGWEECKSANSEPYFVNHNAQTTHWEDPRLEIYMQQQNAFANQYREPSITSSTSSLSSSIGSISTSSSIQSLNTLSSNNFGTTKKQSGQPLSIMTNQYNNTSDTTSGANKTNNKSNKDVIRNLQQNLDQVLKQKTTILQQLELLSQRESSLKGRLSQSDLDEVLFMLKNQDSKMHGFNRYDQANKAGNESINELDNTLINSESCVLPTEPHSII